MEQVLPRAEEYMHGLPEPAGVPVDQNPAAAQQQEAPCGEEEVEKEREREVLLTIKK